MSDALTQAELDELQDWVNESIPSIGSVERDSCRFRASDHGSDRIVAARLMGLAKLLRVTPKLLAVLAEQRQTIRDREAELLRCRTHENVAAVTLDKTLNREQRDALRVACDKLAEAERQRDKAISDAISECAARDRRIAELESRTPHPVGAVL